MSNPRSILQIQHGVTPSIVGQLNVANIKEIEAFENFIKATDNTNFLLYKLTVEATAEKQLSLYKEVIKWQRV